MKSFIILICLNLTLFAQLDIVVPKESKIDKISDHKLTNIYLQKDDTLDGKKITPIDNVDNYNEFYKKVIKKSPAQIHAYWMKEIFTGKRRPPKRVKEQELEKELKKDKNSISYTSKQIDAKVIHEIK